MNRMDCVVIGASSGGLEAILRILSELQGDFVIPLVMVLHIRENSDDRFIQVLAAATRLRVQLASDKTCLERGTLYVARPGYHLHFNHPAQLGLSIDPPVNHSRPSIDLLFESAAVCFGPHVLGILLTGANSDGSLGLQQIHEQGGHTVVQCPREALMPEMPESAIALDCVDEVLTLGQITAMLNCLRGNDSDQLRRGGA